MNKKAQLLVIEMNKSEALIFSGCFGIVFSLPNFYQIFLKNIFPIIIENSTQFTLLFKILYVLLSLLLVYNSYHWIVKLFKIMKKTRNIHRNYNLYIAQTFFFGISGFVTAVILNNRLF